MPSTPSGSTEQLAVLDNLIDLTQNASVDTANMVALVDRQIADMEEASDLFEGRYNFWNTYIQRYETEKRWLNGLFITNPVETSNYTTYPNPSSEYSVFAHQSGTNRLDVPAGTENPARIPEFDGGGATSVEPNRETAWLPEEEESRLLLLNGFNDSLQPLGLQTLQPISSGQTTVRVSVPPTLVPFAGRVVISNPTYGCIALITNISAAPDENQPAYDVYYLTIELLTEVTNPIPSLSSIVGSLAGFTNTERSTMQAVPDSREYLLEVLSSEYRNMVIKWKEALEQQRAAIVDQLIDEDAPDTAYNTSQLNTLTFIQNWVATPNYDDTNLNTLTSLNTLRVSQIPTRVAWINNRLTSSGAYDERYKYVGLLFNRAIGSYVQLLKFKDQRQKLAAQQPILAQRAAMYEAEKF